MESMTEYLQSKIKAFKKKFEGKIDELTAAFDSNVQAYLALVQELQMRYAPLKGGSGPALIEFHQTL